MKPPIKQNMGMAICILALCAFASFAQAASFDCAKAQTKVEHLICDNPKISELDSKLGQDYQDVLSKANDEQKQRVLTEQKHWLKFTRNVCSDETCFKHAYWSRQAELETFFAPHSPLYKHESDKAEAIKQILEAERFFESKYSPNSLECRQIIDDLKQMKRIRFVDPFVQVQSYEDPELDSWKQQCISKQPLHFSYVCPPKLYPGNIEQISSECSAGYGLPPFKLFKLPPLMPLEKTHYIFYSDDDYGPTNQAWNKPYPGGGSSAGFDKLIMTGCKHQGSFTRSRGGARNGGNYNSVIVYNNQYYLLNLFKEYGSHRLSVESVIREKPYSICSWTSVNPNTSNQGNK